MRFREESEIRKEHPEAIEAMRSYLQQLGLHPEGLATKRRPAAFIDLVRQQLKALRLAFELFELGRKEERREQFASLLVREPAMKYGWYRMPAQEIRS
jgi:hypothetical protein